MMKRIILSVMAVCAGVSAWGAEGDYITFRMNDTQHSEVSYAVGQQVDRLVFSAGKLLAQKGQQVVKSFDQAALSRLYFTSTPTAITLPTTAETTAEGLVYGLDGTLRGNASQIKTLPKGVYILRQGNVSHKIIRR